MEIIFGVVILSIGFSLIISLMATFSLHKRIMQLNKKIKQLESYQYAFYCFCEYIANQGNNIEELIEKLSTHNLQDEFMNSFDYYQNNQSMRKFYNKIKSQRRN